MKGANILIDINLFEQLTVIAKCGTLSAASDELHISQPALSKSMKKLENLLNITLFERSKNKITLNETGKLTAELALSLVRQEYELIERITAFHQSNSTISFVSNAPVPIYDIVPILNSHFSNMSVSSQLLEKKKT